MPESFDLSVTVLDHSAEITTVGELDFHSAPRLRESIVQLINDGVLEIVVDLSRLKFIDSSGLGVLVATLNRLQERGGSLQLRSPSPQTARVLEISGLRRLLPVI